MSNTVPARMSPRLLDNHRTGTHPNISWREQRLFDAMLRRSNFGLEMSVVAAKVVDEMVDAPRRRRRNWYAGATASLAAVIVAAGGWSINLAQSADILKAQQATASRAADIMDTIQRSGFHPFGMQEFAPTSSVRFNEAYASCVLNVSGTIEPVLHPYNSRPAVVIRQYEILGVDGSRLREQAAHQLPATDYSSLQTRFRRSGINPCELPVQLNEPVTRSVVAD